MGFILERDEKPNALVLIVDASVRFGGQSIAGSRRLPDDLWSVLRQKLSDDLLPNESPKTSMPHAQSHRTQRPNRRHRSLDRQPNASSVHWPHRRSRNGSRHPGYYNSPNHP